ncbi:early nodulin-like protein 1 [Carica papaya]|uniref:early nodulin-like protein 1 n=1 Tax=Carica papaya TaxID=3649 RepID=UPI000B8D17FE|nr:early nodulin-like protein 1 [Carica papaya]
MELQRYLLVFFVLMASCLVYSSHGYKFYAGGRDGWVLHPSEDYNHWAGRSRFQVNDIIVFKYKKGSDSVLVVGKDDYNNCNTKNPIKKMEDGDSVFKFEHSGPFFFISGEKDNCKKGQKLIVVVMAVRSPKSSPAPATSPVSHPPKSSMAPSPHTNPPASSSSPITSPPSEAPSPTAQPPVGSRPPSQRGESTLSPAPSSSQSGTPSDISAPAPAPSKSPETTRRYSGLLGLSVGVVLSVVLGA